MPWEQSYFHVPYAALCSHVQSGKLGKGHRAGKSQR
jgi:hypothetical protein